LKAKQQLESKLEELRTDYCIDFQAERKEKEKANLRRRLVNLINSMIDANKILSSEYFPLKPDFILQRRLFPNESF